DFPHKENSFCDKSNDFQRLANDFPHKENSFCDKSNDFQHLSNDFPYKENSFCDKSNDFQHLSNDFQRTTINVPSVPIVPSHKKILISQTKTPSHPLIFPHARLL